LPPATMTGDDKAPVGEKEELAEEKKPMVAAPTE
jgi:hypothetical protein